MKLKPKEDEWSVQLCPVKLYADDIRSLVEILKGIGHVEVEISDKDA
jgi:hypothetical protein